MKANIIIEYKDKDTLQELLPTKIIPYASYGKNTFKAIIIPNYKIYGDDSYTININPFKKKKLITFYYERSNLNEDKCTTYMEYFKIIPSCKLLSEPSNTPLEDSTNEIKSTYKINLNKLTNFSTSLNHNEIFYKIVHSINEVKNNKNIKTLIFPKGIYKIPKNNFINFNMENLTIDFNNSTFIIDNSSNISAFIIFKGAKNLVLKNANFTSINKNSNESISAIEITNGYNLKFEFLNFYNLTFNAITINAKNSTLSAPSHVSITNCSFNKNNNLDIYIQSGYNIDISNNNFNSDVIINNSKCINLQNNSFTSNLEIWEKCSTYKLTSNKFLNSKILYRYCDSFECSNNTYTKCNITFTNIGIPNDSLLKTITNESYTSTTITSNDDINITNSIFKNYSRQLIAFNGSLNNCIIENGKFQFGVSIYNSNISNCIIDNIKNLTISNSTAENCIFNTNTSSDKFKIIDSNLINCKLLISKFNELINIDIENNTILINDDSDAFLSIILGKTKNLILKNNTIKNHSKYPIINISDSLINALKSTVNIENNTIFQEKSLSIIDGINFDTSLLILNDTNNYITNLY